MTVPDLGRENRGVEQQDKSKSGVLNSRFNCQRLDFISLQTCSSSTKITRCQGGGIMQHYNEEYIENVVNKNLEILRKGDNNHCDEQQYGQEFGGFGNLLRQRREIVRKK